MGILFRQVVSGVFLQQIICWMEGQWDYNAISRSILKKYEQRLNPDLLQKIHYDQQIALVTILPLDGHELVLLNFHDIPTTMLLSQEWPRELLSSKRSFAFAAESQSEGRGQHSNGWISPPGNMYLTLLIEKDLGCGRYFSMLIANTMIKTIKAHFQDEGKAEKLVHCKWVNDIFIGNLKVCGSLVRASNEGSKFYFEIGVGVNLKNTPVQGSTCLQAQTKKSIDVMEFTLEFARDAMRSILWLNKQTLPQAREFYRRHLIYLMQKVNIFKPDMTAIISTGIFEDVTEEGMAVILDQNGQRKTITNGKMRPTFTE